VFNGRMEFGVLPATYNLSMYVLRGGIFQTPKERN